MAKERMLLLPKSFIQSYLEDLDEQEKIEIMNLIFSWYLDLPPIQFESKVVKILFNNLLPFLSSHKENYENGSNGGAPKGNSNAKKKQPQNNPLILETTPLVLKNNPKDKDKDNTKVKEKDKSIDKDNTKDKDNLKKYKFISNKNNKIEFDMLTNNQKQFLQPDELEQYNLELSIYENTISNE